MTKNRSDIAWLAGLIEGEGTLFRRGGSATRPRWFFSVEMTDRDVVEKAARIWGYGSVRMIPARHRPYALGRKDIYIWRFEDRAQIYALVSAIFPWLGERRKAKAKQALLELPPVVPIKRKSLLPIEAITKLRSQGLTIKQIAKRLGCSKGAIQPILAKLNC